MYYLQLVTAMHHISMHAQTPSAFMICMPLVSISPFRPSIHLILSLCKPCGKQLQSSIQGYIYVGCIFSIIHHISRKSHSIRSTQHPFFPYVNDVENSSIPEHKAIYICCLHLELYHNSSRNYKSLS